MVIVVMAEVIGVLVVVVKVLVWDAAVINMVVVVEVLLVEVRAGVEIIVSVELLADGNANVFASLMTALEFVLLKPW